MPYAALTYRVKPGHEKEIGEVFADFQRVDSPVFRDGNGQPSGRLLGTAVFLKDDVLVRVIHYEGELADLARHMARQPGVHAIEKRLAPYLAHPRDTSTAEGFGSYFQQVTMRCVSQLSIDTHPDGEA